MESFLNEEANFIYLTQIFELQENPTIKLITLQLLTKSLTINLSQGPVSRKIENYYFKKPKDDKKFKFNMYHFQLMSYFLEYLNKSQFRDPEFIINSICNFFGCGFKIIIRKFSSKVPEIYEKINSLFFSNFQEPQLNIIGMKVLQYCLQNATINQHYYGYFAYRRILVNFQDLFLKDCLNFFSNTIKSYVTLDR